MSCSIDGCERDVLNRGWCGGHYRRWLRHGDPTAGRPRYTGTVESRIWARVDKSDDCWIWTGSRNNKGYGQMAVGTGVAKKPRLVHRLVWEIVNGEQIPDGLVVMHACDNPPCVRPDHLSVGTTSQNITDMWARGRR